MMQFCLFNWSRGDTLLNWFRGDINMMIIVTMFKISGVRDVKMLASIVDIIKSDNLAARIVEWSVICRRRIENRYVLLPHTRRSSVRLTFFKDHITGDKYSA